MDSTPLSSQALPSGTRLEEFVIERVLGSGGFGITYLARDARLGRQVVIKENLPVQFCFRDPSSLTVAPRHSHGDDVDNFRWSLENFSKEAAMLASLDHPGIVKVLRSFEALGTAYFVMPFVEGLALDELAMNRQDKPFGEDELRGLLEQVLAALSYLHDRGIYHRDIKPGNILVTNDGIPVLIDFGSARQRLSERSMTVVESAGYTPFEQLQSRGNVGPWSDLYALGGTLVKVMTGDAPPKAMDRMRKDPFSPLAKRMELVPQFTQGFLQSLDQALAVDEDARWQDASEWQVALRGNAAAVTPSSDPTAMGRPTVSNKLPDKKSKPLSWGVIAASVGLGIMVLYMTISNKQPKASTVPVVVEEAAIQRERNEAEITAARAKDVEERMARAEQERQRLAEQAKEEAARLSLPGSKAGEEREFTIAPGVKISMCWIPPGEFLMGSPVEKSGRFQDETQHLVKLSQGFWLAKTETTQAQWQAVMGNNPSRFIGENLPLESVSWDNIAGHGGFIEKANQSGGSGGSFSLPTEAQWEYACRAGTTGGHAGDLDQMAWHDANSASKTHPVAMKKPNAWGLHDMLGNVGEWCMDWYGEYPGGTMTDPRGAGAGSYRVVRGGSWVHNADNCRVARRIIINPAYSYFSIGFRVARSSVPGAAVSGANGTQ